ncbi:MAG: adenine deaminase [Synergistaceae bacterium]|nr:adenine deaminase [Synergistaceae bacterium]
MNHLLAAARGGRPADLVIRNARVANVFTMEYEDVDVAVCDGKIAGLGKGYEGVETFDAGGSVLVPGMIDGHVHIESTMLAPPAFADAVAPHGTTAVMADPHEIANALGMAGVEYMHRASQGLPVDVLLGAPSCVPASDFETPYDELDMFSVQEMFKNGWCQHLGEMMNFPAIINGDPAVWGKIAASGDVPLTGHAPGVSGKDLNAYLVSGVSSDHESSELEEAREKLRRGMWLMIREGASFPNLRALLPLLREHPLYFARCMAVTDDITALYIKEVGHMDAKVRIMTQEGIDPFIALRLVTLSPAEYFRLWDRGALAPGRRADMVLVDNMKDFNVLQVWKDGRHTVRDGELTETRKDRTPLSLPKSVHVTPPTLEQIQVPVRGPRIRVIGVRQDDIMTHTLVKPPRVEEGLVVSDPENDIAKIVVLERHRNTGRLAVGFVSGLGIKRGAIASSVAHDAHNFVAAGMDDRSIVAALTQLCGTGGGLTVAEDGRVRDTLPLPVGGLMSDQGAEETAGNLAEIEIRAKERVGIRIPHPFMALSFLCLSVIPELRITDQGYVDITKGGIQPLFVR